MSNKIISVLVTGVGLLSLLLTLQGCEDGQSSRQAGQASSVGGNEIELILRPGLQTMYVHFYDEQSKNAQSPVILSALEGKGVIIERKVINSEKGPLFVRFKPIMNETIVNLNKNGLAGIQAASDMGGVNAKWEPGLGNELRYEK